MELQRNITSKKRKMCYKRLKIRDEIDLVWSDIDSVERYINTIAKVIVKFVFGGE